MGTLALTLLLLTAGGLPADVFPMNQRSFQIPIHVDPARRADFKELLLYSSTDQGKSWQQAATATPDKDAFTFFASADGLYWFTVVAVDQKGNREPPDINKAPPSQRILIDTVKPLLRIVSAERQGDDIVVSWDIQEENPDLSSLKLEYRTADTPAFQWSSVTLNQATSGKVPFHVTGTGPVTVRMQIQDQAGNVASAQADVAASASMASAPVTPPSPPATPASFTAPVASPSPPPSAPPSTALPGSQYERMQPPPPAPVDQRPAPGYNAQPWGSGDSGTRVVAETSSPASAPSAPPVAGRLPRGAQPPFEVVNSPQVTLEYDVERFGPSGVGSVELYVSRDDGVWQRLLTNRDVKPPTPAELAGSSPTIHRSLTVELPGEGTYGLYLVVRSGAGLGKPAPQNGDPPQMRVEVDLTRPEAKLYAPEAVPGQRNQLQITWTASDRNLAPRPITLEWAERPGGRWEPIATDLPNTGAYTWTLTAGMPDRVYLRLTVRDTAGNISVAQTHDPVLIDLSEPDGQIKRVVAAGQRS